MPKVKVLKDGKWAQHPSKPQLEVKEGEEVEIDYTYAAPLERAGKCKILKKRPAKVVKSEADPAKKDKKKSEANPAEEDKKKAHKS